MNLKKKGGNVKGGNGVKRKKEIRYYYNLKTNRWIWIQKKNWMMRADGWLSFLNYIMKMVKYYKKIRKQSLLKHL
jgi:hypothetical protein